MDVVIEPITVAVEEVKEFVDTLKTYFDGLSFRRRLEELTPTDMIHARGLKDQAHRQLEQVRGRLLHADNDNARDSIKERLQFDVHRRLEAHLAERKLAARQLDAELVSISNLKVSITFTLDSRMLIEAHKDADHLFPLVTKDTKLVKIKPLKGPFFAKLAVSFSVDVLTKFKVEADAKALVHFLANDVGIEFDLSSGANERAIFKGDWTQTITSEVASERCHTQLPGRPSSLIMQGVQGLECSLISWACAAHTFDIGEDGELENVGCWPAMQFRTFRPTGSPSSSRSVKRPYRPICS